MMIEPDYDKYPRPVRVLIHLLLGSAVWLAILALCLLAGVGV